MPLQTLSLALQLQWQLYRANTGYGNSTEGPDNVASYSWAANSSLTTTWNQQFNGYFTIFSSGTAPGSPSATAVAGGSLSAGTYYYKVTAVAANTGVSNSETQGSGEVNATTSGGNLTIQVSWAAVAGATSYNVYRGTAPGSENLLVGNTTGTSFNDTGFAGSSASPPGSTPTFIEFSIRTFTNLVSESVTAAHALSLFVLPTGTNATCVLSPGASNGLTWFFGGTTPTHNIPINGVFLHSEDPSGTGQVLDSTHNTLRITNGGSAPLTAYVVADVSTS